MGIFFGDGMIILNRKIYLYEIIISITRILYFNKVLDPIV